MQAVQRDRPPDEELPQVDGGLRGRELCDGDRSRGRRQPRTRKNPKPVGRRTPDGKKRTALGVAGNVQGHVPAPHLRQTGVVRLLARQGAVPLWLSFSLGTRSRMVTFGWKRFRWQLRIKAAIEKEGNRRWKRNPRWLAKLLAREVGALWGHMGAMRLATEAQQPGRVPP